MLILFQISFLNRSESSVIAERAMDFNFLFPLFNSVFLFKCFKSDQRYDKAPAISVTLGDLKLRTHGIVNALREYILGE